MTDLERAREIAESCCPPAIRDIILSGSVDESREVRIALAAIRSEREAAVKSLRHAATACREVAGSQKSFVIDTIESLADAFEKGAHHDDA